MPEAWFDSPLIDSDGAPLPGAPLGALLTAQALADPDRPALTAEGRTLSRAVLDAGANRRARWLAAHGVGADDVVMIALPNGIAWYETVFAVWKLGATPAHVSPRLAPAEFASVAALCRPKLVVSDTDPVSGLRFVRPCPVDSSLDASPLPPVAARHAKIATSGGSTGQPKLILDPNPAAWGPDKEGRRRKPGAVIVNPAPLHHSAPFGLMLPALAQGSHIIDPGGFDAETWLTLASRHRASWAYLVPTMMARILKLPVELRAAHDLSSIETLLHMAAPCAPWIKRGWIEWLGPDVIWEVYGGTERIGATIIGGTEWLAHPGSVGRPAEPGCMAILDDAGMPLPAGEVGEIHFRRAVAPTFTYIGAEARGTGDWLSFGDYGSVDEDGYLFIADRRTDMVLSGGSNLYPAEIEAALDSCPGVVGSVVFGLPDEDLGQQLFAVIQYEPDRLPRPDRATVMGWLDGRLEKRKWPRGLDFTSEPIRNDAGKVRRQAWRARYLDPAAAVPADHPTGRG